MSSPRTQQLISGAKPKLISKGWIVKLIWHRGLLSLIITASITPRIVSSILRWIGPALVPILKVTFMKWKWATVFVRYFNFRTNSNVTLKVDVCVRKQLFSNVMFPNVFHWTSLLKFSRLLKPKLLIMLTWRRM